MKNLNKNEDRQEFRTEEELKSMNERAYLNAMNCIKLDQLDFMIGELK